jgi:Dyp-type peroxidase family
MLTRNPKEAETMGSPEQDALADIQGNIVAPFNKDHQTFLLLAIDDPVGARRWLGRMVDDVATSEEVAAFNRLFRLVRSRRHDRREVIEATWVQLLFSAAGLRRLGVPENEIAEAGPAFSAGMKAQAAGLGDTAESDPSTWEEPYHGDIHAMLIVAGDDNEDVKAEVDHLLSEARRHGIHELDREVGHTLSGALRGHEHFGFKDGISQPAILEIDDAPAPDDPPAVPLGEFVLGWPNQQGATVTSPAWTRNGSFVVFRRLRQDVAGFRDFITSTAGSLGETPALVGAQLVGRWASGTPLAHAPTTDDLTLGSDQRNSFDYANDPDGFVTPRFSHIRKVFPRAEAPRPPAGEAARRRILRRGIPYGPQLGTQPSDHAAHADRGLLFVCAQASIEEQFQFIQQAWANDANFPTSSQPSVGGYTPSPGSPPDGPDPVIGQHHGQGVDNLRREAQPDHPVSLTKQFVTTTGGEYFFCPSISTLRLWATANTKEPAAAES